VSLHQSVGLLFTLYDN